MHTYTLENCDIQDMDVFFACFSIIVSVENLLRYDYSINLLIAICATDAAIYIYC